MKVQELAKELGKPVPEMVGILNTLGVKLKAGASTRLNGELVLQIKDLLANEKKQEQSEESDAPKIFYTNKTSFIVNDLAQFLGLKLPEIMKAFLSKGKMVTLNTEVDIQTTIDVCKALGIDLILEDADVKEGMSLRDHLDKIQEKDMEENPEGFADRPPVITIMGHVDHGKTLLLDTIRKSNIVSGESGGITQHIGAYQVQVKGKKLTFLDTPGHAAFTALRARGAQVTDIAILVVAADEGIKPQTLEALSHAKAANVPIMVAINKMDKPDANPDRVKQQLAEHDLVPEDWGGKTVMVPISAKTLMGIDELLDMVILMADMLDLKAIAKGPAKGVVIESRLSRKKGPIATVLVKTGDLTVGDNFVIEHSIGKVRALLNDMGENIEEALPGTPVEILGFSEVPQPGSIFEVYSSEKECKAVVEARIHEEELHAQSVISFESLSQQIGEGQVAKLNLVIKADVNGSLEGILHSLKEIPTDQISINIIHAATGPIHENDIMLAKASSAMVVGFHVTITPEAQKQAELEGLEYKLYSVIYHIVDDVQKAVTGLFKPEYEEVELGRAEVRQLFHFSKVGVIAGCFVTSGKMFRGGKARVIRNKKEVFSGKLTSLKRFKEDVREVASNFECGIVMDGFAELEPNDIIVNFELRQKKLL